MQRYENIEGDAIRQMHHLSKREWEVSFYIAWGFTDKEIAHQLNVSFYTIRTHRGNILNKTGCRNASDLTRWYFAITKEIDFGIKPTLGKILAVFAFLFLILISEINNHELIRAKTITTARRVKSERTGKRKKRTFKLTT